MLIQKSRVMLWGLNIHSVYKLFLCHTGACTFSRTFSILLKIQNAHFCLQKSKVATGTTLANYKWVTGLLSYKLLGQPQARVMQVFLAAHLWPVVTFKLPLLSFISPHPHHGDYSQFRVPLKSQKLNDCYPVAVSLFESRVKVLLIFITQI